MNQHGFSEELSSDRPIGKERIVTGQQRDGRCEVSACGIAANKETLRERDAERLGVLSNLEREVGMRHDEDELWMVVGDVPT